MLAALRLHRDQARTVTRSLGRVTDNMEVPDRLSQDAIRQYVSQLTARQPRPGRLCAPGGGADRLLTALFWAHLKVFCHLLEVPQGTMLAHQFRFTLKVKKKECLVCNLSHASFCIRCSNDRVQNAIQTQGLQNVLISMLLCSLKTRLQRRLVWMTAPQKEIPGTQQFVTVGNSHTHTHTIYFKVLQKVIIS